MKKIRSIYYIFRNKFVSKHPHLYSYCDRHKSVIKFMFAGVTAASFNLLFLSIFYKLFHWDLIISTSLAFILSFIISFNLQKFWTFRSKDRNGVPMQLTLYLLNALLALSLNGHLMHLLVNIWGLWYLIAQIVVNGLVGFYNYFLYKFIIFKPKKI